MPGLPRAVAVVRDGVVNHDSPFAHSTIRVDSPEWYAWLESVPSFAYIGSSSQFTARKERRDRGGWYWKAYRTVAGRPLRAYLGKSADLTTGRLEQAARRLADQDGAISWSQSPDAPQHINVAHRPSRRRPSSSGLPRVRTRLCPQEPRPQPMADTPSWIEPAVVTKFAPASRRSCLVQRTRLISMLQTTSAGRLIVISAPPGSGKTTLLSQWIGQAEHPVAFLALDPLDNDPIRFCRYLCEAVERACPGIGKRVCAAPQAVGAPTLIPIFSRMLNALATADQLALVLDDYHHITDDTIHEAVAFMIEHAPSTLHLVLATRVDPPLPLARLRMRHQLRELRAEDLSFQQDEADAFLRDTMGLRVSSEEATDLNACTEGWVGGLQLAALSLQVRPDVASTVRAFSSGGHRELTDYLMDEVLRHQPAELQQFVLQTSLLDRLCAPDCAAVTGLDVATSQAMLDRLERHNLFLVPHDAEHHWYRYHQLFLEFLRHRLRAWAPERLLELHTRACAWYADSGALPEAIDHALAAGLYDRASELIQRVGRELVQSSEVGNLLTWLHALPPELVRAHPGLCLLHAWAEVTRGQIDAADLWLRAVEDALGCASETLAGLYLESDAGQTRMAVLGEVAALRAHISTFWGDNPATIAFAMQALDRLPLEARFLRALAAFNLGIAHWLEGEVMPAHEALAHAYTFAREADIPYIALMALSSRTQVEIVMGRRRAALTTARQACKLAAHEGRSLPAAAYAYVGMGQVLYELNDLDGASRHLINGINLSRDWNTPDMLVYGYTVLAQVRQAQGAPDKAIEMMRAADRFVHHYHQRPWFVEIMVGQQVRLAIAQQRTAEGVAGFGDNRNAYVGAFNGVTQVRVHLTRGEPDQALGLITDLLAAALAQRREGSATELMMLSALGHAQRGDLDVALAALACALSRAAPEGYVRLFLDEGAPMADLLTTFVERRGTTREQPGNQQVLSYALDLLSALGRVDVSAPMRWVQRSEGDTFVERVVLTAREQGILRRLVAGYSNGEIAQDLSLEVSTVKWHLSHIYSKLSVQSRTQAIRQARALALV